MFDFIGDAIYWLFKKTRHYESLKTRIYTKVKNEKSMEIQSKINTLETKVKDMQTVINNNNKFNRQLEVQIELLEEDLKFFGAYDKSEITPEMIEHIKNKTSEEMREFRERRNAKKSLSDFQKD